MPGPPAAEYPFGRATGSFAIGGASLDAPPDAEPLLAYGANASPERLASKLGPGVPAVGLAATLHGWTVVHSNHVSPYGAVPATIVERSGAACAVHVLLVPERAALDVTEPNYDRVRLTGIALDVEHLGRLGEVDAYVSRWGPLLIEGRAVPLGSVSQTALIARVRAESDHEGV